jgi:hypothetical protein
MRCARANQARSLLERVGARVHQPPQFEEITEAAARPAAKARALHGRQQKFTNAGEFCGVKKAAPEEQARVGIRARLQYQLTAVQHSLQRRHVGEGWPWPLLLKQHGGSVDKIDCSLRLNRTGASLFQHSQTDSQNSRGLSCRLQQLRHAMATAVLLIRPARELRRVAVAADKRWQRSRGE